MIDLYFSSFAAQLSSPWEGIEGAIRWTTEELINPFLISDDKARI